MQEDEEQCERPTPEEVEEQERRERRREGNRRITEIIEAEDLPY